MSEHKNGLFGVGRRTFLKGLGVAGLASAVTGTATAEASGDRGNRAAATPDSRGPVRNNRFMVEIDNIERVGFSRVELPDAIGTDVEYREGNGPPSSRRLKGSNEYDPLLLEGGVYPNQLSLHDWYKKVEDGKLDEVRSTIAVSILNQAGEQTARWEFREAWPARYEPPTLDANADGVATEAVEVLHEGMERTQ